MKSHSKENTIVRTDSLSVYSDHLPELLLPVGNMEMCYAVVAGSPALAGKFLLMGRQVWTILFLQI